MTEKKLLNEYLDINKKPLDDKEYICSWCKKNFYTEEQQDEFAIGFANYIDDLIGEYGLLGFSKNFGDKSTSELLETYKKEKGL